jgi:hypothetical protein
MRATSAGRVTSARTASAVPPIRRMAATHSAADPAARRKFTMTVAPARPSASAMARPMPRDPPVTSAARPASGFGGPRRGAAACHGSLASRASP